MSKAEHIRPRIRDRTGEIVELEEDVLAVLPKPALDRQKICAAYRGKWMHMIAATTPLERVVLRRLLNEAE